jgi:hypothetical protein
VISVADLDFRLGCLAERFESSVRQQPESEIGWGQFLDAPSAHNQIGPYGTSAGLIVLSLAGRGSTPASQGAAKRLAGWWQERASDLYSSKRLAQTLRLAWVHLALRISGEQREYQQQIEGEILRRRLPSGDWGNWWISDQRHDSTPSLFTSSVVVLSLLLLRSTPLELADQTYFTALSKRFLRALDGPENLSSLERAATLVALLVLQASEMGASLRPLRSTLWTTMLNEKHGLYFFFYEHEADSQGKTFGRDYLFVAPSILAGIAGFQSLAPALLRLASEDLIARVVAILTLNDGLYRIDKRDHFSTIDQSFAALLLAQAKIATEQGTRGSGMISRFWYSLSKQRGDNIITRTLLPVFSVFYVTAANSLPWSLPTFSKILLSIGTVTIAGMYGASVVQRLFPGRK